MAQFRAAAERALPLAEDAATRAALAAQLADLADLALDGYRAQLGRMAEQVRARQQVGGTSSSAAREVAERRKAVLAQFERDRKDMIMTLVDRGFYESAASLGEKYLEFVGLVALCEATADRGRLDGYMREFAGQGFAETVFAWHVKEGKQAKLLRETPAERKGELGAFLRRGQPEIGRAHV